MRNKIKCKKCGDLISESEIKQYQKENDGDIPQGMICDDCFFYMENGSDQYDEFSDADPGL